MGKKKKRPLGQYNLEDAEFFNKTTTRDFSTSYPEELDEALERLKEALSHPDSEPGLTQLEFILRRLEKEAKAVLIDHGYPTELDELKGLESEHTYPVQLEYGGTAWKCDVDIQSLSARQVLFSAMLLREAVADGEAEQAAIEMMRLIFAAISADLHDTIMQGARARRGQSVGGSRGQDQKGYLMAIEEVRKSKGGHVSVEWSWRHFKDKHHDYENAMDIGDYEVYYYAGRLYQRKDGDIKTERSIAKNTLKRYFSEIRKKDAR